MNKIIYADCDMAQTLDTKDRSTTHNTSEPSLPTSIIRGDRVIPIENTRVWALEGSPKPQVENHLT